MRASVPTPKSLFTDDYTAFLRLLRHARVEAGVTQTELGERVGQTQVVYQQV